MLKKFLNKKTYNENDLLNELLKPIFNADKIEEIYNKNLDINILNENDESFLHFCAKKGLSESIHWLIKNKANVNCITKDGSSPLFYALINEHMGIIKLLQKNNANINHLNIYNRTILQEAVISGKNKTIDYLLNNIRNVNNCDIYGNNLIFDAVSNGDKDLITKISKLHNINKNQKNKEGKTVLNVESVLNNIDLALHLMDIGVNPQITDKNGKNFLFYAITKGIENLDILNKAVELGCDINTKSTDGTTILIDCIRKFTQTDESQSDKKDSLFKMIKELIKKGVDVNAEDKIKETAFFAATRSEDKDLISLFLENETLDINHVNIYKETALFTPVNNGLRNLDIILLFLENEANPNLKNIRGQSAIEMLINIILHLQNKKKSYPRITDKLDMNGEYVTILEKILDSSKVNLAQLNSFGKPLFFDVVVHYNYPLFKILMNKGIDINQKDKKGQNILFNLLNKDINNTIKDRNVYLDALQNLLNLGINVNEKDDNGNTVLHLAVANKCEYTVKLFLEAKPDYLIQDKKGRSIIHNCIWKDTTRYFKLIHSYNKEIINISDDLGVRPINYAAFMGKRKLVLDMLEAGALVNNTSKIDKSIISFFKKFHDKILNIGKNEKSQINLKNLNLLAYNMKKEFSIQDNT